MICCLAPLQSLRYLMGALGSVKTVDILDDWELCGLNHLRDGKVVVYKRNKGKRHEGTVVLSCRVRVGVSHIA